MAYVPNDEKRCFSICRFTVRLCVFAYVGGWHYKKHLLAQLNFLCNCSFSFPCVFFPKESPYTNTYGNVDDISIFHLRRAYFKIKNLPLSVKLSAYQVKPYTSSSTNCKTILIPSQLYKTTHICINKHETEQHILKGQFNMMWYGAEKPLPSHIDTHIQWNLSRTTT